MRSSAKLSEVDIAIDKVLKHEGGYQNSNRDSGNKNSNGDYVGTKFGISAPVYEEVLGRPPSVKDMTSLTRKKAIEIYKSQYVRPVTENLGIEPSSPAFEQALDIVINHGYGNAVPIIQRSIGAPVDGKSGPATRHAVSNMDGLLLNNSLVDNRKGFYEQIMKSDPSQEEFRKGWLNRAESFRK